jgi:hypothetical protein
MPGGLHPPAGSIGFNRLLSALASAAPGEGLDRIGTGGNDFISWIGHPSGKGCILHRILIASETWLGDRIGHASLATIALRQREWDGAEGQK